MKYRVNEGCIGCGLCEGVCPGVFYMDDNGMATAMAEDVPEEQLENAQAAMDGCPVAAIEGVE